MDQVVADRNTGATAIERRAKLFRGFADPSRLAILDALCEAPLAVHEIVTRTELSQSNVSNHLQTSPKVGFDVDRRLRRRPSASTSTVGFDVDRWL